MTRSLPASLNLLIFLATSWILSTEPTDVPPYFCTIKATLEIIIKTLNYTLATTIFKKNYYNE
jgi:hypothetical protein